MHYTKVEVDLEEQSPPWEPQILGYLIFIFRFHKSKLANRPLDIEHVKYIDTIK
jgi:hypothetical protein